MQIFLLVNYISFVVGRWREFMVNCHTIQARLHDIALICGGSVKTPVQPQTRRKLFKIYRYLSIIHALVSYELVLIILCLPNAYEGSCLNN